MLLSDDIEDRILTMENFILDTCHGPGRNQRFNFNCNNSLLDFFTSLITRNCCKKQSLLSQSSSEIGLRQLPIFLFLQTVSIYLHKLLPHICPMLLMDSQTFHSLVGFEQLIRGQNEENNSILAGVPYRDPPTSDPPTVFQLIKP